MTDNMTCKDVWFVMVDMGQIGLVRVGTPCFSEEDARDWKNFAKAFYRRETSAEKFTLQFEKGILTENTKKILSERYNMDC